MPEQLENKTVPVEVYEDVLMLLKAERARSDQLMGILLSHLGVNVGSDAKVILPDAGINKAIGGRTTWERAKDKMEFFAKQVRSAQEELKNETTEEKVSDG